MCENSSDLDKLILGSLSFGLSTEEHLINRPPGKSGMRSLYKSICVGEVKQRLLTTLINIEVAAFHLAYLLEVCRSIFTVIVADVCHLAFP